jgi:hypothetical protein
MARKQKSSAQAADANGYEQALADYQKELEHYLKERIKPGLNAGAIALLTRSIARDIAEQEAPAAPDNSDATTDRGAQTNGDGPAPDFEADMHDLQAELGPDWILRFSVHGRDRWLTAEKQDASQHVEAPDPDRLVKMVDAVNQNVAR